MRTALNPSRKRAQPLNQPRTAHVHELTLPPLPATTTNTHTGAISASFRDSRLLSAAAIGALFPIEQLYNTLANTHTHTQTPRFAATKTTMCMCMHVCVMCTYPNAQIHAALHHASSSLAILWDLRRWLMVVVVHVQNAWRARCDTASRSQCIQNRKTHTHQRAS